MRSLKILYKRLRTLAKAVKSDYRFSLSDYLIYLGFAEYPGFRIQFPTIHVHNDSVKFKQLKIANSFYYWPTAISFDGLDWMHQEVFAPASRNFHAYEFGGTRIASGDYVIDAGACEGFFTRYALQRSARVLVIEPVVELTKALRLTFSKEIAEGKVEVSHLALAEKSGQARYHEDPDHLYESRISKTGSNIQVMALDDLIGDDRVHFIKMDVESAEVNAILGASRIIAEQKPCLSIAVYHEVENAHKICSILRELRPDYNILHRGIFAWEGCTPRPFMVYAW